MWPLLALALALTPAAATAQPEMFDEIQGPDDRMGGHYFGPDGTRLDFDDEYWRALSPETDRLWLALTWQVVVLGFGTAWYWANADENAKDWDYPGWRSRLDFSAVRFDDNHFTINHVSHPFAGAAYYALARANGQGIAASAGLAILSSTIWEYGLEWRELVSLNDQFFTPLGGVAIGEGIYRIGHYLNSAPGGGRWPHELAAATLGFPVWLHRRLEGRRAPAGPTDSLGFSGAYHHRFRLSYARVATGDGVREAPSLDGFDLEVDLHAIPGLGRPGAFDVLFTEGNLFDIDVDATWDDDGEGGEWGMRFESVLVGYLDQDITAVEGDPDTRDGMAAYAGLGAGYEHRQRWRPEPRDRWSMVLLPGPDVGLWFFRGPLVLRGRLSLYPTFTAIDSVAAPAWFEENPGVVVRSVLRRRGYYYGFGLSSRLEVDATWGWLRLGGTARFAHVESVEGLDREQDRIELDEALQDDLIELRAYGVLTVPGWLVSLGLDYTHTERWGRMGGVDGARDWERLELTVGIEF